MDRGGEVGGASPPRSGWVRLRATVTHIDPLFNTRGHANDSGSVGRSCYVVAMEAVSLFAKPFFGAGRRHLAGDAPGPMCNPACS